MRNHGRDLCEVRTHDPEDARETPYPLGFSENRNYDTAYIIKNKIVRTLIIKDTAYNLFKKYTHKSGNISAILIQLPSFVFRIIPCNFVLMIDGFALPSFRV